MKGVKVSNQFLLINFGYIVKLSSLIVEVGR